MAMQEAIPYDTNHAIFPPAVAGDGVRSEVNRSSPSSSSSSSSAGGGGEVRRMVAENPVLVVGSPGCCMCHVARRLLLPLGVNPTVFELVEDAINEAAALIEEMLDSGMDEGDGKSMTLGTFPVVFIGGRLIGGLDKLMALHISGELVPILKEAGALWL